MSSSLNTGVLLPRISKPGYSQLLNYSARSRCTVHGWRSGVHFVGGWGWFFKGDTRLVPPKKSRNFCDSEYDGTLGKEAASFHWIRPWSRDEIFPSDMSGRAFGDTLLLVKFTSPNIIMHTYRKGTLMYHRVTSTHTPKHQTHCRCSGLSQNPEVHRPAVSLSGQHCPIGAMRHKLT